MIYTDNRTGVKYDSQFLNLKEIGIYEIRAEVNQLLVNGKEKLCKYGFSLEKYSFSPAFYISENHPLVRLALNTYEAYTGEKAEAHINAGGTYAKYLPCCIETGTQIWHRQALRLPAGHGKVHQPDEWLDVNGLLEAIELMALYIIEADKL